MTPHPQSLASLFALNENLRREALYRSDVYGAMEEKLERDLFFVLAMNRRTENLPAKNTDEDEQQQTAGERPIGRRSASRERREHAEDCPQKH